MNRPLTHRMLKIGRLSGLLVAATALCSVAVLDTASAVTVGFAVGTAPAPGSKGLVSTGNYFAPKVAAGQSFTGSIVMANANPNPVSVVVYPVDGLTSPNSGTAYSNNGQALQGAGTWIAIAKRTFTLPAGSRTDAQFIVTVPAGATAGDHLAGVAVEGLGNQSSTGSGDVRVKIVTRSVIGVLVSVPGHAVFSATLGTPQIKVATYGIGQIYTPITNTGGLLGRPLITIRLTNDGGYAKSLTRALDTILPGDKSSIQVYWPDTLRGRYTVSVCAHDGGLAAPVCMSAVSTVNKSTGTPKNTPGPFPTKQTSSFPIIWVVIGGVLGAIVFLGGGTLLGIRYAKRLVANAQLTAQNPGASGPPVPDQDSESMPSS